MGWIGRKFIYKSNECHYLGMVTAFDGVAIYKTQIKVYKGYRFAKHWTYEAFLNWIKDGTITLIPSNGFIKALMKWKEYENK